MMPASVEPSIKEIPYDYVAKFKLTGEFGKRVQDVINISVEGAFVAVAIAYSFIPAFPPLEIQNSSALNSRISPLLGYIEPFVKPADSKVPNDDKREAQERGNLIRMLSQCLAVQLCGIDFKYSIVDSGSGRELQNQPIHNIAGLGESGGDRPFRPFAKPMLFMPRSTIRIEIIEISEGPIYGYEDPQTKQRIGSELYIVLHGYKMLGYGTGLP
jgi:hypothetical protein